MRTVIGVCLMLVVSGCGPSKAEQTLSSLNLAADGWDGKPDFVVAGSDAYGRPLASRIEKGPVNYVLEIRSYGPDGLPRNSDDIVVTRRHRHGESSLAKEAGKATGEVVKGAASGAIQGLKEGIGLGKPQADKPAKDKD